MVNLDDDDGLTYLDVTLVPVPRHGLKTDVRLVKELGLAGLPNLELREVAWDDVTEDDLGWLSESALPANDDATGADDQPGVLGLSVDVGAEDDRGRPPAFCLSSVERALLVKTPDKPVGKHATDIFASVTHSKRLLLAGFRLYENIQLLHYHFHLHFARGYDLIEPYVKSDIDRQLDAEFGLDLDRLAERDEGHLLALETWANCLVAHSAALMKAFSPKTPHVDTLSLAPDQLRVLCTGAAVSASLEVIEARKHKGSIEAARLQKNMVILTQGRYSTRARRDDTVTIDLGNGATWACKVIDSDGRDVHVRPVRPNAPALDVDAVVDLPCEVIVAPHEAPQETARRQFAASFLLGGVDFDECRVLRSLFLTSHDEADDVQRVLGSVTPAAQLNDAQAEALHKIFGPSNGVLVHGPPGSGKTTVIAHAAKAFIQSDPAPDAIMLVVANSNAAIKQCAEALLKHRIAAFRLLASTEYYVGWHAHHYSASLQRKLIKSDELGPKTGIEELAALFRGVRIVLCTLATLATRRLDNFLLDRRVPLLVADEASQIVWSTFLPALWKLRHGLRKAVFVGDAHQLPPYGSQQNPDLVQSIFEVEPRPRGLAEVLLDTCYRMPVPLGDFVSDLVYSGTLVSQHQLRNFSCVRFIDVADGRETRVGLSWSNQQEALACKTLVAKYYSGSNFCIITPYDAQRDLVERELKLAGLPYDGRVQSIDAAQGSEYDYIIISLVRTRGMGFLADRRRMNVMLTRQRKGLCIVANPRFLSDPTGAAGSLVGQLEHFASTRVAWAESVHIPFASVQANIASVPMGQS